MISPVFSVPSSRSLRVAGNRLRFSTGFLIIWVALVTLAGCGPMRVTPITAEPTNAVYPGKVVWHDLLTTDPAVAETFYAGVLGWTFDQRDRYTVVSNDGVAIAGIVPVRPESEDPGPDRWLMSFSVADVDVAVQRLADAGGQIHEGPGELKDRGRFALVSDPEGAELVLLRSSSGDPADQDETALGAWLWNELWSDDPARSLAFYRDVANYQVVEAPEFPEYWILARDGTWRAGVRTAVVEGVKGQWVPGVRVEDPAAVADRVETYGGQVVIHPNDAVSDGNVGLIADPGGALLIVHRWPRQMAENGS